MMKLTTIICLFLLSCDATAQLQEKTTLQLFIEDSRNTKAIAWFYTDTIRIYKTSADTPVLTLATGRVRKWPAVFENLETGDYRVTFKNYYGEQITQNVTVGANEINIVRLYRNKLNAYPQNTLATFVNGDSLVIRFASHGCFHWENKKIVITREKDSFIARIYYPSSYHVKKKKKLVTLYNDGAVLSQVILTKENLQDFIRFENELNNIGWGGCTTTDTYILTGKINVNKTDGSCKWNGFDYLEKALFKELLK